MLISNSYMYGLGIFDHCIEDLKNVVGENQVLFIPYALNNYKEYTNLIRQRLQGVGLNIIGANELGEDKLKKVLKESSVILIGGGNSFRLIHKLYTLKLIKAIKQAVQQGAIYIGASAGANVACPTIKTTNDMPIIYPKSFNALNLVPFQINPHYIDTNPSLTHMGETRERRINEYHEENDKIVIGLFEGSWLNIYDSVVNLRGNTGAKVFTKNGEAIYYSPQQKFDIYLNPLA